MKNFLQDLVAHTHSLGFLPLVKITASEDETLIESMSEDRSVILTAVKIFQLVFILKTVQAISKTIIVL